MADLRPANENPWYVLMTLYGEQDGDEVDLSLHRDNVAVWNAWTCQSLTSDQRENLVKAGVLLPEEGAWEKIKSYVVRKHMAEMKARNEIDIVYQGLPHPQDEYDLREAHFPNLIVLDEMIFTQDVHFLSAKFEHDIYCVSARFTRDASFRAAMFVQRASFLSAVFEQGAYFANATFTRGASFDAAVFGEEVFFDTATFKQDVSFAMTTFTQGAIFQDATFLNRAYFQDAKIGDREAPNQARFDLSGTRFDKPATFRDAEFLNRFPEFSGAIVHEKTIFPIHKQAWPQKYPLFDDDWIPKYHERDRTALMQEAASSCAFLRHHVAGQGLPEAEYLFFSREMEFLAQIGGWWQRLPYRLFGLSDYGTSISKPAIALAGLWLICALIYMTAFNWPGAIQRVELIPTDRGFGFSAANMFKFFGFQRTYYPDLIGELPSWMKFLAALQTTLAYVMIFFLGLGLRARFRLR